jgi:FtsP/CotA-like multicopper oxidase with cupredoxin domain
MPRSAEIFFKLSAGAVIGLVLGLAAPTPVKAQGAGQTAGEGRRFEVEFRNGHVASGLRTLRAMRGDRVEISWTSDRPVTLHLHGYDIEVTVGPGSPQSMIFTAYATGRFPIEAHESTGAHRTLIHVEVHPR